MFLHHLLAELPTIVFGKVAAALMPAIDELSAAPWRSQDFPGGSQGPITIALTADGAFAAYGDDDEHFSHRDLIRRVNASVDGLPAELLRTDWASLLDELPEHHEYVAAMAQFHHSEDEPEDVDRENIGRLRSRRVEPTARDQAIREQAMRIMAGIGEIELYMLIRLAVVDADICCWQNRTFSWEVQPASDGTHTVRSLNVGIIAWGLSADEAQFLVTAGQRIFAKQREGYDV